MCGTAKALMARASPCAAADAFDGRAAQVRRLGAKPMKDVQCAIFESQAYEGCSVCDVWEPGL